ncbi:GNAT family N-acetyltransferase [Phytoactinopolyspora mesophila]|uniref:GNAT family N-acetyltransferase n=1 Tax=Phytoactinopolyspora mesophila TaxID=2650750 RepID=A0A7K3LXV1_9ACTN|nr:GNAT family N-acetyltransferase [Phytoactinopolyspora mesophila]NDL55856.1 GNAT family N-acetyltransferase [Phytoactinopolyspora mesophila]
MITVHPATGERWDDVVAVMGTRGDPSRCWCQFFMFRQRDWHSTTTESRRAALQDQVRGSDASPGVLAYADNQPVGWCAVAPKAAYPRLLHSPNTGPAVDGVWSVTCFVVKVGHRRQGVATALLAGAVDHARSYGAEAVEGYPVEPSARASVAAADLYHGTASLFADAGFVEINRPSPARAVVRLDL